LSEQIVLQLQEHNRGIEEKLNKLQAELILNRQIVIKLELQIDNQEEYSTSIENIDEISVEIIPSITRKPSGITVAIAAASTPKKTKKEERKESLQRASAWALDRRRTRENRENRSR
jgi:hypothetical protein